MYTFKSIAQGGYQVRPIYTHKTQNYEYTWGSTSNIDSVTVGLAVKPLDVYPWEFDTTVNDDGTNQNVLYASVENMFYDRATPWSDGVLREIPSGDVLYVISVVQQTYGERIQPTTVEITTALSLETIIDDGNGNLIAKSTQAQIGHVFYEAGIMILPRGVGDEVDVDGLNLIDGSVLDIGFKATHTIYEHSVICTMDVGDMSFTLNPSITKNAESGELITDAIASGSLVPYMTTVGLYNNENQLVAVAKFPRPIKRVPGSTQSVIVRWDV